MKRIVLPVLTSLLALCIPLSAQTPPLELRWNELAPLIVGHRATLTLTGAVTLKGDIASVRDDSLVLEITTPAPGYPKGNGTVPRSEVTLITLEKTKGSAGRAIGTTIGVLAGLSFGGALASATGSVAAGIPVFFGIATFSSTAGYQTGRALDRKTNRIKIIP